MVNKILHMIKSTPIKSVSTVTTREIHSTSLSSSSSTKLKSALRNTSSKKVSSAMILERLMEEARVLYKRYNKKLEYLLIIYIYYYFFFTIHLLNIKLM